MQVLFQNKDVEDAVQEVSRIVSEAGGRSVLVGGCVRDSFLKQPVNDLDIEVFGLSPDKLQAVLASRFRIDLVGKAFGVIKLMGLPVDVSLPRRESKSGLGHKGFHINSDSEMSFEEAASRRDFTVNSIGFDLVEKKLLDPFNGRSDIEKGILRHVSEKFSEDPLRVFRGMQFAARFNFKVAEETVQLCRKIEPEGLPKERIYEEWKKLILKGVRPSKGLRFLKDCGWIRYYPELKSLIGCEQDSKWHPEGDVWTHTLHCMDAFSGARSGDDWEDLVVGFGTLCHDLGKPLTTRFEDGRLRSKGHESRGEGPTRSFLLRLTNQYNFIDWVVTFVTHHLRPLQLFKAKAGDTAIRRLARNVKRIDLLVRVAESDHRGRPGLAWDGFPSGKWLLERAEELRIKESAPKPIVMGRHLVELGLKPGSMFGLILDKCYEAQLAGKFLTVEEGISFARLEGLLK